MRNFLTHLAAVGLSLQTALSVMTGIARAQEPEVGETVVLEDDTRVPRTTPERRFYFGGLLGTSDVGSGNSDTSFGATLGGRGELFGAGIYGTFNRSEGVAGNFGLPTGTDVDAYRLLGEIKMYLAWLHIGLDIGAAINSWSDDITNINGDTSDSQMIIGPQAGVDIPIGGPFSLGAEAHYLVSTDSTSDNELQAMGALKIWL